MLKTNQTKYYTLEYVHDEEGVSVNIRPNGAVRSDYFVRTVAYVDFNFEHIKFYDTSMKFELIQEICNHLHELNQQHLQYLNHIDKDFDDDGNMKETEE